jgi:hypothetical protein
MTSLFDALALVQAGYADWAAKDHNTKWVRKIDGTPIPNDLCICIATRLAELSAAHVPLEPSDGAAAQLEGEFESFGVFLSPKRVRALLQSLYAIDSRAAPAKASGPSDALKSAAVMFALTQAEESGRTPHECARIIAETTGMCAPPSSPDIPDGWRLVPVEPTEAMLDVCVRQWKERMEWKCRTGNIGTGDPKEVFASNYRAMIAAAPSPETSNG